MDIGCGPGFFSIEMARLVGNSGHVIAVDLQEGMLRKLKQKIVGTELEERITLHHCKEEGLGVTTPVDFVLLFYMVHEVDDQESFLSEIERVLRPDGRILMVEPPFHVSSRAFEETLKIANVAGLVVADRPKLFLNKTALLTKGLQTGNSSQDLTRY